MSRSLEPYLNKGVNVGEWLKVKLRAYASDYEADFNLYNCLKATQLKTTYITKTTYYENEK